MKIAADANQSPGSGRRVARRRQARSCHALVALPQRVGRTRLGVLAIGKVVSPLQRELLRRTRGRVSLTGRAPVLLLTTTGRRTGKSRTVPLLYLADHDRFVVCNVNPGFERQNPWTLNLRANPDATIEVRGSVVHVRARQASDDELKRYWPDLIRLWPAYGTFFDRGGTRTVFVLEPDAPVTS